MSHYFAIICDICDLAFIIYIILWSLFCCLNYFLKYIWMKLFEVFSKLSNFEKIVYLEFPYFKNIYWELNTFLKRSLW